MQATSKQIEDFEMREKDSQVKDRKVNEQIVELQRKIEKSKSEATANEQDLEKKREELRTIEQNIKIHESGGQVEDHGVTLQKNLESSKLDLQQTINKQKSLKDELRRNAQLTTQNQNDLKEL